MVVVVEPLAYSLDAGHVYRPYLQVLHHLKGCFCSCNAWWDMVPAINKVAAVKSTVSILSPMIVKDTFESLARIGSGWQAPGIVHAEPVLSFPIH